MKTKQRGFTLIEVVVALMVLALGLAAVIQSITGSTRSVAHMRDKTMAHWVAMNKAAEMQSLNTWPDIGTDSGKETLAGQDWYYRISIRESGIPKVRQLEIEVRLEKNAKTVLDRLVALVEEP